MYKNEVEIGLTKTPGVSTLGIINGKNIEENIRYSFTWEIGVIKTEPGTEWGYKYKPPNKITYTQLKLIL